MLLLALLKSGDTSSSIVKRLIGQLDIYAGSGRNVVVSHKFTDGVDGHSGGVSIRSAGVTQTVRH